MSFTMYLWSAIPLLAFVDAACQEQHCEAADHWASDEVGLLQVRREEPDKGLVDAMARAIEELESDGVNVAAVLDLPDKAKLPGKAQGEKLSTIVPLPSQHHNSAGKIQLEQMSRATSKSSATARYAEAKEVVKNVVQGTVMSNFTLMTTDATARAFNLKHDFVADLHELWDQFDADKNGFLDLNELKKLQGLLSDKQMGNVPLGHLSKEKLGATIQLFEQLGTGKVAFYEFADLVTSSEN
eukprot:gnl/TRDRNA2_/TRDRNA2_186149_c0_seq1.p1 gnl/TRDRNA2_/TRDRNA2_186149_c0~~gnl/TRDRNA2_/TRDRNA2_186149_c0_seq1.p1  ORF type:complete len:241 (-),score=61.41 gnl/TRDRNA2_/TRDRNA2_186149_c0_seq1:70-792(-)